MLIRKLFEKIAELLDRSLGGVYAYILNILEKISGFLKTDTNALLGTFFSALTIYFLVDRIAEFIIMITTGIGIDYWSPLFTLFAVSTPFLAFLLLIESKSVNTQAMKIRLFYLYGIAFAIISVLSIVSLINAFGWNIFFSAPNYKNIILEDRDMVLKAFVAITIYIPFITFQYIYTWFKIFVRENDDIVTAIPLAKGITFGSGDKKSGPYSLEVDYGIDEITGEKVLFPEEGRFYHLLTVGHIGMGKTEYVIEPMIAKDLQKKRFLIESSKKLAYTLLRNRRARLTASYSNEYMNKHFSFDLLAPTAGNETFFNNYLKKVKQNGKRKDLGITYVSTERNSIDNIIQICEGLNLPYKLVDPLDENTVGINPFEISDPEKAATTITELIYALTKDAKKTQEFPELTFENIRAIQNVAILLKETYPDTHTGQLPTIQDISKLLSNFTLVEAMVRKFKKDFDLSRKHPDLIKYFEDYFFEDGKFKQQTEQKISGTLALIDTILKEKGIKKLLGNRLSNVNFEKALNDGEIILVCLRKGQLSNTSYATYKALGQIVFNLYASAANASEVDGSTRTPNFLYFDDFIEYINKTVMEQLAFFTKQNVGIIASIETLQETYDKIPTLTLFTTFSSKMVFGDTSMEESGVWSNHMGVDRLWTGTSVAKSDNSLEDMMYFDDSGKLEFVPKLVAGQIQGGGIGRPAYKLRNGKGRYEAGLVNLKKLDVSKYSKFKSEFYDFVNSDANLDSDIAIPEKKTLVEKINSGVSKVTKKEGTKSVKHTPKSSGPIQYK